MAGIERRLSGRIALVTGAGQRLGRAIAEGLGAIGADVAVHFNSSREGADEAVKRIQVDGSRAAAFGADLTKPEQIAALVEKVEREFGPISILVNSAAAYERYDFLDTPLASLDQQWALNVRAPFLLAQEAGKRMKQRGSGDILNIVDIGGVLNVWRHYAAYTLTKAALGQLTESLAVELAPEIRVNGVAPGSVLPPAEMSAETRETLRSKIPAKRFGSVVDVVEAVQFLVAGPQFVTGQIIAVDGGRSLSGF